MTVLGYFNSLRELGGARWILEEEVQNTLKRYGDRRRLGESVSEGLFRDRTSFSDVVELTSRVGTGKVAEARTRLDRTFHDRAQRVDCAIATRGRQVRRGGRVRPHRAGAGVVPGAACHGCTLVAETSCEMRNEYLDRALVVPTLYAAGAAFFDPA